MIPDPSPPHAPCLVDPVAPAHGTYPLEPLSRSPLSTSKRQIHSWSFVADRRGAETPLELVVAELTVRRATSAHAALGEALQVVPQTTALAGDVGGSDTG
jgi:hypothetical protein